MVSNRSILDILNHVDRNELIFFKFELSKTLTPYHKKAESARGLGKR